MRYYLWNDRINPSAIDKDENPEHYFRKLIVPEDNHSLIANDFHSLLSGLSDNKRNGYAYFLYTVDDGAVVGKIAYVAKKSPADIAGLSRGAVFTHINGTGLTAHNYQDLIAQMSANHTLTVRNSNDADTDYRITITGFAENPVFLDTVYCIGDSRIAYLVYNAFVSDNGDLSQEYDLRLNEVFGKFRNRNINELILDLRYNANGNIFSSMIMASLIVPAPDTKEIYARYQYNKSLQQTIVNEFGDEHPNLYYTTTLNNVPLNNAGDKLDRVFILTSPKTGVMSEILVNALQLSTKVVIVGQKSEKQNLFSVLLYEDDPEKQRINGWVIVPVVIQVANRAGNTDIAFVPDVEIAEPLYDDAPLGDIREKILATTLNMISNSPSLENSKREYIIPQRSQANYLQSLSIKSVPSK
jgi:hypothetical protein